MRIGFSAPLGALLLCAFAASPALAGGAIASAPMTLRAGPGDSFDDLVHISAGSVVDLHECNTRQWCRVDYRALTGWVHVRGVEQTDRRSGGGAGGSGEGNSTGSTTGGGGTGGAGGSTGSSTTALAEDSSTGTGGSGGSTGSRSLSGSGGGGTGNIISTDSGGGGSGSGGGGSDAAMVTEICVRC